MKRILVVDDDHTFCLMLKSFLFKNNFDVFIAGSVSQALNILIKTDFDLILSDYRLPDKDGLEFLEKVLKINPESKVIMMTSYGDIRLAVRAMKMGALDYITKPINPSELLGLVKNTLSQAPNQNRKGDKVIDYSFKFIEGVSAFWKKLEAHIQLLAPTDLSVIILGESGTGKEFVARRLHELSKRNNKPFVAVDCGALTPEIANSELFGHVKGAFTGAISEKKGQFEIADGGTIFLDEIGNLNYEIQIKLLRVLQERIIRKVGSTKDTPIDIRLIVATNDDLKNAVQSGSFREDLYHRLNEFVIHLEPLRNRKEDLLLFTQNFLELSNADLDKSIAGVDEDALERVMNYSWPGNLRELKNVIRRSVLLAKGTQLNLECLPSEIMSQEKIILPVIENTNLKTLSQSIEKETILRVLKKVKNKKTKAAKLLNIDRKTLYTKLKDYDIHL